MRRGLLKSGPQGPLVVDDNQLVFIVCTRLLMIHSLEPGVLEHAHI